ncbi:DNA-binding response OmpR family regulator [Gracilibacillus halotolerans]|uniref:DNA-binding response OmpR family regulator n=1 Tax=Gracilibacillus halotolerans TaxID=74386 RepID=A0A841RVD3_9BACI|nr:DNA-binding response OmpR family regulator [Gracilibacillus halotolerans]
MKILLVEDNRTIALGLDYSLKQEGYETIICYDASTATDVIQQESNEIDVCLFDLSLPDGSGYDLCKLVKERGDIPVIFLTALDDEVNVVMGLDMGADDYITKPFRIRELLSRIKSVLGSAMLYSIGKIKNENIIESLKQEYI